MSFFRVVKNISLKGVVKVWFRNWRVFRKMFWRAMVPTLFEPLLYLVGLGLGLALYIPKISGLSYLEFIAPGLVASSAMFGASYECTYYSFIRMKYEKVYDAMLATPLTIEEVIAGEILWGATRSLLTATVFLAAVVLFGLVKSPLVLLVFPVIFLAGLLFGIIGMVYTAIIPDIGLFNYYFTLFITPLFLFSGIFYPVEALPEWAEKIAFLTPLYHVVEVCRGLSQGLVSQALFQSLAWLVLWVFLLFLVPIVLMKRRLIK
jgi:lipooligosaccharide transport system permease protein